MTSTKSEDLRWLLNCYVRYLQSWFSNSKSRGHKWRMHVSTLPVEHEIHGVCGTPQAGSLAVGWQGWARWWPARLTLSSACWQIQSTNAAALGKACKRGQTQVKLYAKATINAFMSHLLTILFLPRRSWKIRRKPESPRWQSGWSTSSAVCPAPARKRRSHLQFMPKIHKKIHFEKVKVTLPQTDKVETYL